MEVNHRNRLLLGLLLGALGLSTGLNFYLLKQQADQPINYELEAGLPTSVTEMELVQVRAQLAECQGGQPSSDTLAEASRVRRMPSF